MSLDEEHWEQVYNSTRPEALPWNAGAPDADLVERVQNGRIPKGQALDLGTGPGNDAIYLIQQGFDVIAIDISASAIRLARENASHAGVFGFFQQGDIRKIPVEDAWVDFVNDRGCFHTLSADDRMKALAEILRVMKPKARFLLKVFSDKEPGRDGPARFTRQELETFFQPRFSIVEFFETEFAGPRKPKAYGLLMEKR